MKKSITQTLRALINKPVAFMSLIAILFLAGTISVKVWGPNKSVINMGGKCLATVGIVASFKKKGIELDEDEKKQYEAMDEAFSDYTKGLISEKTFTDQFSSIWKELTAEQKGVFLKEVGISDMEETLKKQAVLIDQIKNSGIPGSGGKPMTLREQIKAELSKPDNLKALADMKSKKVGTQGPTFEVKAAGTMTVAGATAYTDAATNIAFPQPEFIPGLNDIARNQPFILQYLNVRPTGKANILFTEKINPEGAAAWVGEGTAASQVDFDIEINDSRAKMVDAFIKVSVQMLDDVDYIAAEIEKELIYQIAIKLDTDLIQGDGTGENLKGIDAYVGGYVMTGFTTTNPNNWDCVLAAATQISVDNFRPDIAFMNTKDYNQTLAIKGTTGHYVVNPNNDKNKWAGIMVVPSNQIAEGKVLVMDSSKTNCYNYKDFQLSYGWVNDDFTNNLVTIMGAQRVHFFIKANDVNAFVSDDLANIKAAIAAV